MTSQTPEDLYVDLGRINTRYWALGDEGDPVILIHGLGGYAENWGENVAALAAKHRVYVPDLVGFGLSDKPIAPYTLDYFAEFVKEFMLAVGIDRASMAGWSLGGAVSLQFASRFPDELDKLVLVSSAGLGKEVSFALRLLTLPLVGEALTRPSRKGTKSFYEECVDDPGLITSEWIELGYQMDSLPNTQRSFLATLRAGLTLAGFRRSVYKPILDKLGSIRTPTLIIWGQQDRILPVEHGSVAKNGLPNARLHVFDPCGHLPPLEHPEAFNRLVLDFLAE